MIRKLGMVAFLIAVLLWLRQRALRAPQQTTVPDQAVSPAPRQMSALRTQMDGHLHHLQAVVDKIESFNSHSEAHAGSFQDRANNLLKDQLN